MIRTIHEVAAHICENSLQYIVTVPFYDLRHYILLTLGLLATAAPVPSTSPTYSNSRAHFPSPGSSILGSSVALESAPPVAAQLIARTAEDWGAQNQNTGVDLVVVVYYLLSAPTCKPESFSIFRLAFYLTFFFSFISAVVNYWHRLIMLYLVVL